MRNRNTLFVGKVLLDFPSLPSTNLFALDMLSEGRPDEGTIISARSQTQGRGQAGATWESEPGKNILLSVILYPDFVNTNAHFSLNQAIALAVRDLVAALVVQPVYIKWPNDIYIADQKTAGILLQTSIKGFRFQHCVAGIGINVNQTAFPEHLPNAVSPAMLMGREWDLHELREELFICLEERYLQLRAGHTDTIREEYIRHLYRFGEFARFQRKDGHIFEGRITDVSPQGLLQVQHEDGVSAFDVKEVAFL